jgi:hypothetical protein
MAVRKSTRSVGKKSPPKGGNEIKTHPNPKRTGGKPRKAPKLPKVLKLFKSELDGLPPAQAAAIRFHHHLEMDLEQLGAVTIVACAALEHQNCEFDQEAAHVMRRYVTDVAQHLIERSQRVAQALKREALAKGGRR